MIKEPTAFFGLWVYDKLKPMYLISGRWNGIHVVWFSVGCFSHHTKVSPTWQPVSIKTQWECSGYYIDNPKNLVGEKRVESKNPVNSQKAYIFQQYTIYEIRIVVGFVYTIPILY